MTDSTSTGGAMIAKRLLSLANAVLQVEQAADGGVTFQCSSESKGFLSKKQNFEARIKFDEAKKEIRYWEMISEKSKGFSSDDDTSFGKPSFVLKGLERSGTGEGFVSDGGKYKYDLGKVESMVKSIAKENNWGFRRSIGKP